MEEREHKDRVREQFGRTAQGYVESVRHRTGADLARLVELADAGSDDEALDIATGGGHTALALAPHVRHVVASDLTPEMLEAASAYHRSQGVTNVSYEIAEAERLPFADAAFDIVSCRVAPHHFSDPVAFCREVARVLRPGGRFVMMDSVVPEDDELDHFINDMEWRRDKTHVRSYRISEWTRWIEDAGLRIEHHEPVNRTHKFEEWTQRSGMDPTERDELERDILNAPERVRDFFVITSQDGRVQTFADHKVLLRAVKPS